MVGQWWVNGGFSLMAGYFWLFLSMVGSIRRQGRAVDANQLKDTAVNLFMEMLQSP